MKLSKAFTYIVIALVMVNNIEHLAYVHYSIARRWFQFDWMNQAHSVIVVVIVELAIIELVRRGKSGFAGFFTLCLFILSLIYYPLSSYLVSAAWGNLIAAVVFSIMFTISIWYFSLLAAEENEENNENESYRKKYQELAKTVNEWQRKLALFNTMETELAELRKFKAVSELSCICPNCEKVFPSENAKRGHMATCNKSIINQ
jgi:hypothetical protein